LVTSDQEARKHAYRNGSNTINPLTKLTIHRPLLRNFPIVGSDESDRGGGAARTAEI
jgi:hypothetical protein